MRTEDPRAIHLADYHAPDFHIETVALDFALDPQATRVTARLQIARIHAGAPLVLTGEDLKLISISLDGRILKEGDYALDGKSLTLANGVSCSNALWSRSSWKIWPACELGRSTACSGSWSGSTITLKTMKASSRRGRTAVPARA